LLLSASLAVGGDGMGGESGTDAFVGVWKVNVEPDHAAMQEGRHAFKDMVLFESDGFFTAEAFGPMGFDRAEFTVTNLDGGATAFTTTMSNPTQGTLVWNGVKNGSGLIGSLVWTRPDGDVDTYSFNGELLD
jgi:hypothetical protein